MVVTLVVVFILFVVGFISFLSIDDKSITVENLKLIEVKLCDYLSEDNLCVGDSTDFPPGSKVHFIFSVEVPTNVDLKISGDYSIKNQQGELIYDGMDKFFFSGGVREINLIHFKGSFFLEEGLIDGEYFLNINLIEEIYNLSLNELIFFEVFNLGEGFLMDVPEDSLKE